MLDQDVIIGNTPCTLSRNARGYYELAGRSWQGRYGTCTNKVEAPTFSELMRRVEHETDWLAGEGELSRIGHPGRVFEHQS